MFEIICRECGSKNRSIFIRQTENETIFRCLDCLIEDTLMCNVNVRIKEILRRKDITRIKQLKNMSDENLLKIRHLTCSDIKEIRNKIRIKCE